MEDLLAILASLFFGFVPMFFFAWLVYWTDRYEKEPKLLLGAVFLWGAIVAAGGAFIVNTILGLGVYMFTENELITDITTGSLIAPLVEESLKGFAVLVVFLVFRREFDSILDGIVYGAIAALGFAATENAYYIFTYGYMEGGFGGIFFLVFVRVILVGWQHPFYTAFTGIGFAVARLNRSWFVKIVAPLIGFVLSMLTHSFHNLLASLLQGLGGLALGTFLDWSGWLVMFIFVLWAVYRDQRTIVNQLREEVALGIIKPAHFKTASSAWRQSIARTGALFNGRYRNTARFYQLIAELAHKKQQRLTLGEEGGNTVIIDRLRAELARLAPFVEIY
ncbi:MAG: PrsW family intramembrane metalloprotease [Anaerolineales bacterium]|nr:PrsW family intramembrane metalloprotease [Anaerolineales bacterium]